MGSSKRKARTHTINVRIEEELKEKVDSILEQLGLSNSEAIRLFLKQIVFHRGIPFEIAIPNRDTLTAMDEARAGFGKKYKNKKELFDSWEKA